MSSQIEASQGLVTALKGSDQETLVAAIQVAAFFDETPGDDRQRLRGNCCHIPQTSSSSKYSEADSGPLLVQLLAQS